MALQKGAESNKASPGELQLLNERVFDAKNRLQDLTSQIANYETNVAMKNRRIKEQKEKVAYLTEGSRQLIQANIERQRLLGNIDDLAYLTFIRSDQTSNFKLWMSGAFAVLVGLVKGGYFTFQILTPKSGRPYSATEQASSLSPYLQ